jgi:hypothetical protein
MVMVMRACALAWLVRVVRLAVLGMAVAPQHEFLEYEETEDAAENGERRLVCVALVESVRDHFEKGGAEQRADGKRHEHRNPTRAQVEREGGQRRGKDAAGQARGEDPAERHGGGDST